MSNLVQMTSIIHKKKLEETVVYVKVLSLILFLLPFSAFYFGLVKFCNDLLISLIMQECGPRFTLKLVSLQHGTFDTKGGEFEWVHKVIASHIFILFLIRNFFSLIAHL